MFLSAFFALSNHALSFVFMSALLTLDKIFKASWALCCVWRNWTTTRSAEHNWWAFEYAAVATFSA
jgi:hypothetical protein